MPLAVYLLCLALVCTQTAGAQLNSGNLTQYLEKDGLPGSQVNGILIDRLGYVWAGTINGLTRFDGNEFKRFYFNPNDSASILGLICWSMQEDRKGNIWVSCSPSYLNVYDPGTRKFRQYPFLHLVPHALNSEVNMRSMGMDNRGRIYFGLDTYYGERISNGLLYKDENDSGLHVFKMPDSLAIDNVYRITTDSAGNVMFLTNTGIFRIDANRRASRFRGVDAFYTPTSNPNDIAFDGKGHLLMITWDGTLVDFDLTGNTFKKWTFPGIHQPGDEGFPNTLKLDKEGNVWLGSTNGMFFFDRRTESLSRFNSGVRKDLEKGSFIDFAVDAFGNVWAGTFNQGLLKYENRTRLRSIVYEENNPNSLLQGWASKMTGASDGKSWIISGGNEKNAGISILDTRTGSLKKIPFSSLSKRLNGAASVWEVSPGVMRIVSFNGIMDFHEKTLELTPAKLPGTPDSAVILHHTKDSHGNEWLCLPGRGLYKKEMNAPTYVRYDLGQVEGGNLASNGISMTLESPRHGLWIIGDNGLFLYDYATGKITRKGYDKKKGDVFLTQDINSIYEDPQGIVWVGTWQGGLSRYDMETGKIKTYTREDGLPSMGIQGILPDEKNGALWLSTFEGLSRFDLKTGRFNNFGLNDGIQGLLFADGAYLKTVSGSLIFGGSNGITIINPDEVKTSSLPPRVFLTDLKLFNRSVIPGKNSILSKPIDETADITLGHDQNNLSIDYQALHFSDPSKNIYQFKLENYDNEWREVGNQRTAYYPNLPPGDYVFRVKAANDKGVWTEKGASLAIHVNPPWWKTIWAYIAYGLLALGIAFALDRYLRYRILEKEREKNRSRELEQAREIQKAYLELEKSHETLKNTQKQLIQSEKMASLGELTAGIAHEIQNPLNFVNNFSEVNAELSEELKTAAEKGDLDEVRQLAGNIRSNEEKIRQHGKRADAIVKSMLQHSRTSTGQKEPTDINALCAEYFNLAYHGMRARDKSFNTAIESDYEPGLPPVHVAPQDMGRVLLNLCNNAFFAVAEKAKSTGSDYRPVVKVSTSSKKTPGSVTIVVEDNGPGISASVMDKIFQPFFTTKPTGQGTGLGLSLSYDIIKTHGGELKIESKEGYGSSAIIRLPF